ncbi:hypothetical protein GQ42DRAFT_79031, partial [Ramicandelaber brevisporus]
MTSSTNSELDSLTILRSIFSLSRVVSSQGGLASIRERRAAPGGNTNHNAAASASSKATGPDLTSPAHQLQLQQKKQARRRQLKANENGANVDWGDVGPSGSSRRVGNDGGSDDDDGDDDDNEDYGSDEEDEEEEAIAQAHRDTMQIARAMAMAPAIAQPYQHTVGNGSSGGSVVVNDIALDSPNSTALFDSVASKAASSMLPDLALMKQHPAAASVTRVLSPFVGMQQDAINQSHHQLFSSALGTAMNPASTGSLISHQHISKSGAGGGRDDIIGSKVVAAIHSGAASNLGSLGGFLSNGLGGNMSLQVSTTQIHNELKRFRPCDDDTLSYYCREWATFVYRKLLVTGDIAKAAAISSGTATGDLSLSQLAMPTVGALTHAPTHALTAGSGSSGTGTGGSTGGRKGGKKDKGGSKQAAQH